VELSRHVVLLHSVLALLAGFAVMIGIVFTVTMVLMRGCPRWVGTPGRPSPAYVLVNMGYSFVAAVVGGFITAYIAVADPLRTVLVLALVVLVMSALSVLESLGRQPVRYQIFLAVLGPIGVVVGGLIRLKLLGVA
jgi:hypothetical protein